MFFKFTTVETWLHPWLTVKPVGVYCITLVQSLYISCYVFSNKLVLSYLSLCLLPHHIIFYEEKTSKAFMFSSWIFFSSNNASPEKRNVQRSPGSPISLPDWIHEGLARQSRSYCLQNLAPEPIFTNSSQTKFANMRGKCRSHSSVNVLIC